MRIGIIGLGSIAQKAYLPFLGTRGDLDLRLMTRSSATLRRVAEDYRVPVEHQHTTLDGLLDDGVDAVFVHTPTDVHRAVVGELLTRRVPTFVDKPLEASSAGTEALLAQARAQQTPLFVGFNRRFAPAYTAARRDPFSLAVMRKDATGTRGSVRELVFDDVIHVVDTLVWLLGDAARLVSARAATAEGRLTHVTFTLGAGDRTAIGIMDRSAGAKHESLQLTGHGRTLTVTDLEHTTGVGSEGLPAQDGWAPVAVRRGFAGACDAFLDAVRHGREIDGGLTSVTHRICEEIVDAIRQDEGERSTLR